MTRTSLAAPAQTQLALERLPNVKKRTGLSRTEIYRRIRAGTFPRPVELGDRARAWRSEEIDGWITGRIVATGAKAPA